MIGLGSEAAFGVVGVEEGFGEQALDVGVRGVVVDEGAFAASVDEAGEAELGKVLTDRGLADACEFGEAPLFADGFD